MLNSERLKHLKPKDEWFTVALLVTWCLIQTIIFFRYGILTNLEASKYIREASNIIESQQLSSSGYVFYLTEIFLIVMIKIVDAPIQWVIVFHLFANLIATYYLRELIKLITNTKVSNIGALVYIIFIPVQQFNFQLQTESIFLSLIIIHSYFSIHTMQSGGKNLMGVCIIQGILLFTRPSGVMWMIPTAFVLLIYLQQSAQIKIQKLALIVMPLLFIAVIEYILKNSNQLNLIEPFESKSVLCGVTNVSSSASPISKWDGNSIFGLFNYIYHNFNLFLILAQAKTKSFFTLIRPYYSTSHNIFLIVLILPIYLLSFISFLKPNKKISEIILLCSIAIIMNYGMVILTCDDWHNRFFLSTFSYFILLASIGKNKLAKDK